MYPMRLSFALGFLCISSAVGLVVEDRSFSQTDTITRDVVVIGGGASGTYAAIRLKDLGKTVALVEKTGELGGHTTTYTAEGGTRVDFGVSNFQNYSVVRDYFARFNIPLVQHAQGGNGEKYVDFTTGQEIAEGTLPAPDFEPYFAQLAKYPYLEYSWDLPQPVPEDLLLPFGKFVEKYNLESAAYTIALFAAGHGNVLDQITAYVLKAVDRPYLEGVFGASVTPASHDTQSLYLKAQEALGPDALLSSTIASSSRSKEGIQLTVQTPRGRKLIRAKKLLISAPPKLENMTPFGLDSKERDIFSQFQSKALYVGLVKNTGLEEGYRYYNADTDTEYAIAPLPDTQMVFPTRAPGIFWAWYSSPVEKSEKEVKAAVIKSIKQLVPGSNPEFVAYKSHSPSAVGVSADKIRDGFYDDLKSLQGYRNTWYTGATFVTDHSAALWNFTEYEILPKLTV